MRWAARILLSILPAISGCLFADWKSEPIQAYGGEPRAWDEIARIVMGWNTEGDPSFSTHVLRVDGMDRDETREKYGTEPSPEPGFCITWDVLPGQHSVEVTWFRQTKQSDTAGVALEGTGTVTFNARAGETYLILAQDAGDGPPEIRAITYRQFKEARSSGSGEDGPQSDE